MLWENTNDIVRKYGEKTISDDIVRKLNISDDIPMIL